MKKSIRIILIIATTLCFTGNVLASCQLEAKLEGVPPKDTKLTIQYFGEVVAQVQLDNIEKSIPFKLRKCPKYVDNIELVISKDQQEFTYFKGIIIPGESQVLLSHAHTLASGICQPNCTIERLNMLENKIENEQLDKVLEATLRQKPNYLSVKNIHQYNSKFSVPLRKLNNELIENLFVEPPKIGDISSKAPKNRDIFKQWAQHLSVHKTFIKIANRNKTVSGIKLSKDLKNKLNILIPRLRNKQIHRGYKTKEEIATIVEDSIDKLKNNPDAEIQKYRDIIATSWQQAVSAVELPKDRLFDGLDKNTKPTQVVANWFRHIHHNGANIPVQLSLYSEGFKRDFNKRLSNQDDSLGNHLRSATKKYSKAMKYTSYEKFSNNDTAAFNRIIDEVKPNIKTSKNTIMLHEASHKMNLIWIFENNNWRLDSFQTF